MLCSFLVLLVLISWIPIGGIQVCSLSSKMNLDSGKNYFYPLDIYAPYNLFQEELVHKRAFVCYGGFKENTKYQHSCSKKKYCPIIAENVVDATAQKFDKISSICHLKRKLSNKQEKINVFVFGGSVTAGTHAGGCVINEFDLGAQVKQCAWPYRFGEWIRQSSEAEVVLYNLAEGGQNSYLRSRTFYQNLVEINITAFTSNDIIFIDHAVNDHSIPDELHIEKGLESLILRIYSLSKNASWPTIIVLDSMPADFDGPEEKVYPIAYDRIVRHYNLTMWSYTNASLRSSEYEKQRNFSKTLQWKTNYDLDVHPSWDVHLFMADLYASIFSTELNQCNNELIDLTSSTHSSSLELPHPLSLLSTENECNAKRPTLLSYTFKDSKKNHTVSGSYKIEPENSWSIREDRKDRSGLIVELVDGKNAEPNYRPAKVSFVLNETTANIVKRYKEIHIQMMYLRTYENAGLVDVSFCGEFRQKLSALWKDYTTNKISIPELFDEGFSLKPCTDGNYQYPIIEFRHHLNQDKDVNQVMGNQKFKIMSITACGIV